MTSHHDMIPLDKSPFTEGESPLKILRKLLGDISQEEFARRIGVSVATVSRWERGVTPVTLTIPQMKALLRELRSIGLDIESIPDDVSIGGAMPKKNALSMQQHTQALVSGGRK